MTAMLPCADCGSPRESSGTTRPRCRPCHNTFMRTANRRNRDAWREAMDRGDELECLRCGIRGSGALFSRNRPKRCLACYRQDRKETRERRPQYVTRYSLSIEQYMAMLESQEGRCRICRSFAKTFCVDHDHSCCPADTSCGSCIRGLLCHNCNTAIGYLKDDPTRAFAAALYLEEFVA